VLLLPFVEVADVEQVVGVVCRLFHPVDDHRRADELPRRDLGHVFLVLAGHPVVRRVQVSAGALAGADVVPVPGRAAVVVAADLLELEGLRLAPLRRELEDRGVRVQRGGEVNDLDPAAENLRCELGKVGHDGPFGRCDRASDAVTVLGRRLSVKPREALTKLISLIYHFDIRLFSRR